MEPSSSPIPQPTPEFDKTREATREVSRLPADITQAALEVTTLFSRFTKAPQNSSEQTHLLRQFKDASTVFVEHESKLSRLNKSMTYLASYLHCSKRAKAKIQAIQSAQSSIVELQKMQNEAIARIDRAQNEGGDSKNALIAARHFDIPEEALKQHFLTPTAYFFTSIRASFQEVQNGTETLDVFFSRLKEAHMKGASLEGEEGTQSALKGCFEHLIAQNQLPQFFRQSQAQNFTRETLTHFFSYITSQEGSSTNEKEKALTAIIDAAIGSGMPLDALVDTLRKDAALSDNDKEQCILFIVETALKGGTPISEIKKFLPQSEEHFFATLHHTLDRCAQLTNQQHGMSSIELFKTALFVETNLPKWKQEGVSLYFKRVAANLPRSVEFDAQTGCVYIHLKARNVRMLGQGAFKKVTRSLIYNAQQPTFAAQAVFIKKTTREIDFLNRLQGPGIVKIYGVREISARDTKPAQLSLMQKLYNGGTLAEQMEKGRLTTAQKHTIAASLLLGLKRIHEQGIVHGDFHDGQVLIQFLPPVEEDEEATIQAVVTDFGLSFSPNDSPNKIRTKIGGLASLEEIEAIGVHRIQCSSAERTTYRRLIEEHHARPRELPVGYLEYRNEVSYTASLLSRLLLGKPFDPEAVENEQRRFEYEDKLKSGILSRDTLSKEQAIEYLILRMAAWPAGKSLTATEAFNELASILG